jgi:branched-subunit amino acid transport protein
MPPANADPVDLIALIVAIVTYIATKEVAELISPYIAIVMAAGIAAAWALSREGELTGAQSAKFFGLRILTAVVYSVMIANLIHLGFSWMAPRYTAVPIAGVIGLVKNADELKQYIADFVGWFKSSKKDG